MARVPVFEGVGSSKVKELIDREECCYFPVMLDMKYYQICRTCDCCCKTPGEDDGGKTCWQHHDCMKGECTHGE